MFSYQLSNHIASLFRSEMDSVSLYCKVESQTPLIFTLTIPPYYSMVRSCSHCLRLLSHPVVACINDHILCNSCVKILTVCAICHENLYNLRTSNQKKFYNLSVTYYKCRYQKIGCTTLLTINDIENHENSCMYGLQECPFQFMSCKWFGTEKNLFNHLVNQHSIKSENDISSDVFFFHTVKGYIFRFTGTQAACNGGAKFCVYYVGSTAKSKKFKYCLTVKSLYKKLPNINFIGSCKSVWDEEGRLENSNSARELFIPYPILLHYFHNQKFKIEVEIIKE